jgi:hypothetical protein
MTNRFTDEQVAKYADHEGTPAARMAGIVRPTAVLAREVQMWRALINGGPCGKCDRGWIEDSPGAPDGSISGCPDCVDGRVPGVIERLEVKAKTRPWTARPTFTHDELDAIIAALRQAVEE